MSKLVCIKCGHESPVPMHCGQEMHKEESDLVCWMGRGCGYQPIPEHCGQAMDVVE
jgi:hypothetical protein